MSFIINPYCFGVAGAVDPFTSGLWGAYGLTKLIGTYAGSAIRVRRSSDSTEQDIGFSGTALDTSSLISFAGAGDAFVTKWYDQTGAAKDLAQAPRAKQIVLSLATLAFAAARVADLPIA